MIVDVRDTGHGIRGGKGKDLGAVADNKLKWCRRFESIRGCRGDGRQIRIYCANDLSGESASSGGNQ